MSTAAHPKVDVSDEHLSTSNRYSNEILPVEHDIIENTVENSDEIDTHLILKNSEADSILLEDETLSVQISYSENITVTKDKPVTTVHTSFNSDLHNSQSSSKVSSLFRHKDHPEASPLKEAIKGFVLSKLSKKTPAVSDISTAHSGDVERRTIFSGIKEKFSKKLEDNSTAKEAPLAHSDVKLSEKNNIGVELRVDLVSKSECELKSVVANDKTEGDVVEEAEECFEETKKTFKEQTLLSINGDRYSFGDTPVLGKRSRSISNLTTTSYEMLKPDPTHDKTLSFSFSDLQRADDLSTDNTTEGLLSNVPEIQLQPSTSSSDPPAVDSNTNDRGTANNGEVTSSNSAYSFFSNIVNAASYFYNTAFKISYGFTAISAILVYWLYWNSNPFLAGILCGMTVFIFTFLLFHELTGSPNQDKSIHFPDYKTLPPLTIPTIPKVHTDANEGWMNQLLADYDQESFKLCNTVSVYVRLEGSTLHLCYPKKEVPKRAMWNEKLPQNNQFVRQEFHQLKGAKTTLLPVDLPRTRVWCKRFPLGIILLKSERQRSPSVDCSSLAEDKSPPSPTKPSSPNGIHSLPTSLSGSPIHNGADQKVIYLFARTDREKEEWYWRFCFGTGERKRADSCYEADVYLRAEAAKTASSTAQQSPTDAGKGIVAVVKDKSKTPTAKPALNFNTYMGHLMKELPSAVDPEDADRYSLQWLNVFLGRLFYDYLTQKKWCNDVQQRIQRKLNRIKMPPYMQELVVTDVYLGTSLPQIRRTSEPVLDERGLWLDLDIEYKGSFQMTLETKIKLQLQTKRDQSEEGEKTEEHTVQQAPAIGGEIMQLNEEFGDSSDDDDLPDSEASKEESSSRTTASVSTGARLLLTVERWVNSTNLAENKFVKKCVGHLTQTPLVLTVEMNALCGTLALNIPPLVTDRLWYGFRKNPELSITVCPKVGDRHMNYTPIVQYIKKKLILEFQKAVVMPNMDDFTIPFMHSTVYEP